MTEEKLNKALLFKQQIREAERLETMLEHASSVCLVQDSGELLHLTEEQQDAIASALRKHTDDLRCKFRTL